MIPLRTTLVDGDRVLHTYRLTTGRYESSIYYDVNHYGSVERHWLPPWSHKTEAEAMAFHAKYVADTERRFFMTDAECATEDDAEEVLS